MADGDQAQASGDELQGGAQQTSPGPAGQSAHSHSVTYDQNQDTGGLLAGMTSDNQNLAPVNMAMNIA